MTSSDSSAGRLAQYYASAADTETEIAVATETTGTVIEMPGVRDMMDTTAKQYARRLSERWPTAAVYAQSVPEPVRCVRLIVVDDHVNYDLEDEAYRLMALPEARAAGVSLDVAVYFRDRCEPELAAYSRVN